MPDDMNHRPTQKPSNIVLIGMPGAGKSTIGVILAKLTARGFVDTDLLIQRSQRRTLQEIVDEEGAPALRRIEEQLLLGLECSGEVIATGGSAVYSLSALEHLGENGVIVFLDADLPTLQARVGNFRTRGIARSPGQTLADLFAERRQLYSNAADLVVHCSGQSQEALCDAIIAGMTSDS